MLVSLEDMKAYLGVSEETYDTFLTQQTTLISDTIEAYCRRKFLETDYVQIFYLEDLISRDKVLDELTLFQYPITAVTSVVEKYLDTDAGDAVTDFRPHKPSGKLIKKRAYGPYCTPFFSYGKLIVEVAYTAGYETVPTPVQQVVYNLVQEAYNKKVNGIDLNFGSDVETISIPGVINIQYDFSLNNNERSSTFGMILGSNANILDFYRSERAVIGTLRLAYNEEDV